MALQVCGGDLLVKAAGESRAEGRVRRGRGWRETRRRRRGFGRREGSRPSGEGGSGRGQTDRCRISTVSIVSTDIHLLDPPLALGLTRCGWSRSKDLCITARRPTRALSRRAVRGRESTIVSTLRRCVPPCLELTRFPGVIYRCEERVGTISFRWLGLPPLGQATCHSTATHITGGWESSRADLRWPAGLCVHLLTCRRRRQRTR